MEFFEDPAWIQAKELVKLCFAIDERLSRDGKNAISSAMLTASLTGVSGLVKPPKAGSSVHALQATRDGIRAVAGFAEVLHEMGLVSALERELVFGMVNDIVLSVNTRGRELSEAKKREYERMFGNLTTRVPFPSHFDWDE